MSYILTSESVNIGHSDKVCDVIADSILDAVLRQDPNAHVAIECSVKGCTLFLFGEIYTSASVDYKQIARGTLNYIGYNGDQFEIIQLISGQSAEINKAVSDGKETGAGDQGMMWGYACNETKELMPLPIMIAHELMKVYDIYRRNINTKYKPDAKSQVSVIYSKDKPIGISNIIVSVSHEKGLNIETIKQDIQENVIIPALKKFDYLNLSTKETTYMINPGGEFTSYGPEADSGTTGRKIAVDTYGSLGKFGGGALSSKDPTKVDRSGAYYARYVAKNVVAAGLADKCEIQVSYAIGQPKPTSIYINCFGTNTLEMPQIYKWVNGLFDFSVDNMINELNLRRPIYRKTACYGHFGREEFPWEKIK